MAGISALLGAVVFLRLLRALGLWYGDASVSIELIIVAGLGALTLPMLWKRGGVAMVLGVGLVTLISVGVLFDPMVTILVLACLHNWTPVGFLAEGLPRAQRHRGVVLGGLAFGVLPVLIASGLPGQLVGAAWQELTVLPTGGLAAHLGAYLPVEVHREDWAIQVFSAMVFAQCMHYATVIGVLPRIEPGGPGSGSVVGLSTIPSRLWWGGVVLLSLIGFLGYTTDFRVARSWYAIIAAVHAWVEVPVLLLALIPQRQNDEHASSLH